MDIAAVSRQLDVLEEQLRSLREVVHQHANGGRVQASVQAQDGLTRMLARHGIDTHAANGRPLSAAAMSAAVAKAPIDPVQRIALKRHIERLAAGLPV